MSLPKGLPERSLGWGCLDWATVMLTQPDGLEKGKVWEYTDDQARFILWYYAVDEYGKWLYRRAYRERAKGVGKTPMVAAIACTELLGPVVFDGFDASGNPVGRPHPNPLIQLAAVSESQADQTMVLINSMLANGPAEEMFKLDIALSRVYVPHNGGKLEKVTASPRSREGARPSFVVMEETHNWVPAENGPEFAAVLRRNLAKVGGRSIEVTNAPLPGENSVAEATHDEWDRLVKEGMTEGVLFDSESIHVDDVKDREEAIPALKWIYRNSPWVDVERIFAEICDSNTRDSSARKYYFNEIVPSASGWLPPGKWKACEVPGLRPLKKTDKIALGFKATNKKASGLVACRLTDMALFVMDFHEKPETADGTWEVPTARIDQKVRKILEKYDAYHMLCEPTGWADIIGRWAADYEDELKIEELWWSSKAKAAKAIEQLESAILDKRMKHFEQPDLGRHISNSHIYETPQGDLLRQRTVNCTDYIVLAQAAVLALEAAVIAIEDGALKETHSGEVWSY